MHAQECHLYNLCPETLEKLFLGKANTTRNIPNESTYFLNQHSFHSGDTLRIQEKPSLFLKKMVF